MGFRTVVVTRHSKCTYKNGYLVVKDDEVSMIHISEIDTLIFETPSVSITGVLLSELAENKVCVIFCNEKHLPQGQYVPFSSNYMSSSRKVEQSNWDESLKDLVWVNIVSDKIRKQSEVLKHFARIREYEMLESYVNEILPGDITNREGLAAKVYFNSLFDSGFDRRDDGDLCNVCLNYGYAILLAMVSREIVKNGYDLSLGLHHKGVYNPYNLACDVMEPFRPIIDYLVVANYKGLFDREIKGILWNVGNTKVYYKKETNYLCKVISDYFKDICQFIREGGGFLSIYDFIW